MRYPAGPRHCNLVRRSPRVAARAQFDGEAGTPAAFLGFGRTAQPGTPRAHGVYARGNRPNDWIVARNGNPFVERYEEERFDSAGGRDAGDSQSDRVASRCGLRVPSPGRAKKRFRPPPFFVQTQTAPAGGLLFV